MSQLISRSEAQRQVAHLESLLQQTPVDKRWTREESREIAPFYGGKAERFSLPMYIELFKRRNQLLLQTEQTEATTVAAQTSSSQRFQEPNVGTLKMAIIQIFYVTCPHPVRYFDAEGVVDMKQFETNLKIWLAAVSATWTSLQAVDHCEDCRCCVTFRHGHKL
jgi:hypothetical protein